LSFYDNCQLIKNIHRCLKIYKNSGINTRAVRFQKFYLGSGSGFFGKEKKPLFGSVSVIFKKEEQYKCMNSFMYVSSIFTK
jgi:hypothetical protein